MNKIQWILIFGLLAAGAILVLKYMGGMGSGAQADEQCSSLAHRLHARLLKEPNPELPNSRLEAMLRERSVAGPITTIPQDANGYPMDPWNNLFRASIVFEGGPRQIEVRSAGPDGLFDTDDDRYAREEF
jgi:hypothetical protein